MVGGGGPDTACSPVPGAVLPRAALPRGVRRLEVGSRQEGEWTEIAGGGPAGFEVTTPSSSV